MLFTDPTKISPWRSGSLVCKGEGLNTSGESAWYEAPKGNMKLESMKIDAKRGQVRKGREIAVIQAPFQKAWHGSLSYQIGICFTEAKAPRWKRALTVSQKPCLYSRGRCFCLPDYYSHGRPLAPQGLPTIHPVGVALQGIHPMPLSPTYHNSDQHRCFNPACPMGE